MHILIISQRAQKVSKIRGSGHKNIFCSPGEEYEKLNNEIVSIASRREKEKEDENIEKTTVEAIIQHDKRELKELLKDMKDNMDDDFSTTLLKIEE